MPLTVLEAAVSLCRQGSELLDRALQRRVRFDALHRAHCRNLGSRGAPAAGRLLVAAADRAASAAERTLLSLLRAAGIGAWQQHYRIAGYEFRSDRQRQNELVLAGWTVLRFTWHDLTQRPEQVVAEIRAARTVKQAS